MNPMLTQIKILDERAEIPSRAHETDTGYDLKFIDILKISGDVIFFKTGIAISPPSGYYFDVVPRSSISNFPLEMANSVGVIDETYRGEIIVPIRITHPLMGQEETNNNFPNGVVKIFGMRPSNMTSIAKLVIANKPKLCQMILRKREDTEFKVISEFEETERGDGGFGSTDKVIEKSPKVMKKTTNKVTKKESSLKSVIKNYSSNSDVETADSSKLVSEQTVE